MASSCSSEEGSRGSAKGPEEDNTQTESQPVGMNALGEGEGEDDGIG